MQLAEKGATGPALRFSILSASILLLGAGNGHVIHQAEGDGDFPGDGWARAACREGEELHPRENGDGPEEYGALRV